MAESKRFQQSAAIVGSIALLGFVIERLNGGFRLTAPPWPYNALLLAALLVATIGLHLLRLRSAAVRWLASIPATAAILLFFFLLSLIAGVIPQEPVSGKSSPFAVDHIVNSLPFALCLLLFLLSLGLTIAGRAMPFSRKNLPFLANHLGLWIVAAGIALGSGDLERRMITLTEGSISREAENERGQKAFMPFSLKLEDFRLEEFAPALTIVNDNGFFTDERRNELAELKKGAIIPLLDWDIEIVTVLPDAAPQGDGFVASENPGAFPAAYVRAAHILTKERREGWLSPGSAKARPAFISLAPDAHLIMTPPRPKRFISALTVYSSNEEVIENVELEVNKPYRLEGWDLYQSSYDDSSGKWSRVSILEAVRDPWLPFVYAGVLLMLAGTFYMLFLARLLSRGETSPGAQ